MSKLSKQELESFDKQDDVSFSRFGKKISVIGRDGAFAESDSVEANLLLEILKALKKK